MPTFIQSSFKSDRPLWLLAALMGPLALIAMMMPGLRSDVELYYRYSDFIVNQHQLPYRDFPIEYPPLALLPMVIPQVFNLAFAKGFLSYWVLFVLQNAVICGFIGHTIVQIAAQSASQSTIQRAIAVYALLATIAAPLLFMRVDCFLALLILLAVQGVLKRRPTFAGVAIGLGAIAKVYPIVLLPVLGLVYFVRRRYEDTFKLVVSSAIAVMVGLLMMTPLGLHRALGFLTKHPLHGLQLESVPAGLLLLLDQWGFTRVDIVTHFGTMQVQNGFADAIARVMPIGFLAVWSLTLVVCFRRFRTMTTLFPQVLINSAIALLGLIVTNQAFSPQPLVWVLPFVPFFKPKQVALFIAIEFLSLLLFPFLHENLMAKQGVAVLLLNLRNVAIVGLTIELLRDRAFEPLES